MFAAARALGWEFRRQLFWVPIALGVYVAAFWSFRQLVPAAAYPIKLDPPNGMGAWIIGPVTAAFFAVVGVFSHGFAGDLAARQSMYPARMFTLPVRTAALAGWPMLFGTSAAAGLWVTTALFLRWPGGFGAPLPWIWPALLGSVFLAWTQAFMWMPYGLRGLRVTVAVLWLSVVDAVVLIALHYEISEYRMIAFLAPQIPLAYLAACVALARARRGEVPIWRPLSARFPHIVSVLPRRHRRFRSPMHAQTWFEWRRHGWSLPAMVGLVVPTELLLLFVPGNDTAPVIFGTLFVVLLTPPFLAVFAAATVGSSTPLMATRPLASAALVAAKLIATLWSAIAAWLLVVAAIPLGLWLSGASTVALERAREGLEVVGANRAVAIVLLGVAALVASTWRNLVQSLCIGLTGRDWLVKSRVFLALSLLVALGPLLQWTADNRSVQSAIWNAFPWILVGLVCVKAAAASWIAVRLHDRRLLSDRLLLTGAVGWLAAVLALYAVLDWFVATPLFPRYLLGAIAILQVPLARVSAAPLALAWNRHR